VIFVVPCAEKTEKIPFLPLRNRSEQIIPSDTVSSVVELLLNKHHSPFISLACAM
jgi:hypothetical protein